MDDRVADLLAQAGALASHHTEAALDLYDQAIALSPWSADAWRGKGMALALAGRFEESLEALEAGVRAAPDDDRMVGLLITNLREVGRKDEAFDRAQAAVERMPRSIWVLKAAADAWRDRGDFYKAGRLYDRGLDLAPDDTMLLNGKATALFLDGQYAAAVEVYRRVTAFAPASFTAWLNIAFAEQNQGRERAAAEAYDQALALRPGDAAALEGRAECAVSAGEAEPFLERLAGIDPARADAARARIRTRWGG